MRKPFIGRATQLELGKNGSAIAKSVAIGAGVGAGFFLVMMGIFAASWD